MHFVCLTVNREWLRNTEAGTGSYGAVTIVTVLVVILYQGLLRVVNHNKIDAIAKHEKSKIHSRSKEIEEQKAVQKSEAAYILITLNKCNIKTRENFQNMSYFCLKESTNFRFYVA